MELSLKKNTYYKGKIFKAGETAKIDDAVAIRLINANLAVEVQKTAGTVSDTDKAANAVETAKETKKAATKGKAAKKK